MRNELKQRSIDNLLRKHLRTVDIVVAAQTTMMDILARLYCGEDDEEQLALIGQWMKGKDLLMPVMETLVRQQFALRVWLSEEEV